MWGSFDKKLVSEPLHTKGRSVVGMRGRGQDWSTRATWSRYIQDLASMSVLYKIFVVVDRSCQQILVQLNLNTLADRLQMSNLYLGKQILKSQAHRDLPPEFQESISGKIKRRRNTLETRFAVQGTF